MNQIGVQVFLLKICHSIKAFNIIASAILLFSFFLISSQTSISQPVDFDFMFGSSGGGAGQFDFPNGIAVDSMMNIYVADTINHRIQVFDSAGNFIFMFGWGVNDGTNAFQICSSADTPCQAGIAGGGAGQFNFSADIAVDSMMNIYVAETSNHRIQVFDSAGNFIFMFGWGVNDGTNAFQICSSADTPCQAGITGGGAGQFDVPADIAVDSMMNIYVADTFNQRIQVFDSAGNFIFMFGWGVNDGTNAFQICSSADTPCQAGITGGGAGQFDFPNGIAVDSMMNIYVADTNNHRIQVFDSAGNFIFMFGSSGGGAGQFNSPVGMAVDGMKNIYVADYSNRRIQVFDSAGNFMFMFGWRVNDGTNAFQICTSADTPCQTGSSGNGAGQFVAPNGIAVDSMKNIYVVDESIRRVQVFSQPQEFFTLNFNIQGIGSVISTPEGIDCPEDCTEDFMSGEVVTLTPITQGNSFFSGWSGDPDCTDGVVTMVEDTTCTATFINNIPIPTLSEWGLIAMAGILGLVGFMVMRRRKVRA